CARSENPPPARRWRRVAADRLGPNTCRRRSAAARLRLSPSTPTLRVIVPRVTAAAATGPPSVSPSSPQPSNCPRTRMTSPDQERWKRVKERLRAEVGEDIYLSWFARMDLERVDERTAHLSVPTRFLKSWIQSHYTERVLACWQAEQADIQKIEVSVR